MIERSAAIATRAGMAHSRVEAAISRMSVELAASRLEAARAQCEATLERTRLIQDAYREGRVHLHLAALAALRDDLPAADAELALGEAMLPEAPDRVEGFRLLHAFVDAARARHARTSGDESAATAAEACVRAALETAATLPARLAYRVLTAHLTTT